MLKNRQVNSGTKCPEDAPLDVAVGALSLRLPVLSFGGLRPAALLWPDTSINKSDGTGFNKNIPIEVSCQERTLMV